MSTAKTANKSPETDGRKLRTNDSRKKIVDAFLSLINEGNVSPSAEQVATTAGVGLRTVFRRFNEMELLHRELVTEVQARFLPQFLIPFKSTDWRGQLDESLARRAEIFELLMPYRIAAKVHKHNSDFIKTNMERWNTTQEKVIENLMPFSAKDEPVKMAAVKASMSFENWIQMRTFQKLPPKQAKAVMIYMTQAALGQDA